MSRLKFQDFYRRLNPEEIVIVHDAVSKNSDLLNRPITKSMHKVLVAAKYNNEIEFLLEYGANIDLEHLLECAVLTCNVKLAEILLRNGVKIDNLEKMSGVSFCKFFEIRKSRLAMLKLLIDYGLRTHRIYTYRNLLREFLDFVSKDDEDAVEIVEILINSGLQIECMTLFYAVHKKNIPLILFLLKKGADIYLNHKCEYMIFSRNFILDIRLLAPLHLAAELSNKNISNILLSHGANIDIKDNDGCTPLHHACYLNCESVIKLLIRRGAAMNVKNIQGNTPYSLLDSTLVNFDQCQFTMLRKISMLKYQNLLVSQTDLNLIQADRPAQEYFESCYNELDEMSNTKFYDYYSYYWVLKMSRNLKKLSKLTKNEDFVSNFKKNVDQFSTYRSDLLWILKEAIKVRNQTETVNARLSSLFGNIFPDVVMKKLADNVKVEDLPE